MASTAATIPVKVKIQGESGCVRRGRVSYTRGVIFVFWIDFRPHCYVFYVRLCNVNEFFRFSAFSLLDLFVAGAFFP